MKLLPCAPVVEIDDGGQNSFLDVVLTSNQRACALCFHSLDGA